MPTPKPQHLIATARLGFHNVELYVLPGATGGEFYLVPDDHSLPRIRVGLAYDDFEDCLSTLLHEATEMALCHAGLRYNPSAKLNGDTANYLFVLDHSQFGDVCSRVAMFLNESITPLRKEWEKQHP